MDSKPGLTQLQRITFEAPNCCEMLLGSSKRRLSRQNSLACVTAGSLQLLRALARFATGHPANEQRLSAETDRTMMSMMPELELLEMSPKETRLLVPFHGILRGELAFFTQDIICQAAVGHCIGSDSCRWWYEGDPPFESMKGWTGSINLCVMGKISTLAPNLEVLHVHIQNQGRKNQGQLCNLILTSAMRSVDLVSISGMAMTQGLWCFRGFHQMS